MSGIADLHVAPAVAGALEALGYSAEDALVRDQAPAAARGTNLALAYPPAARYSAPALAGVVSALLSDDTLGLVLVPSQALAEWAAVLLPLAEAAGLPALAAQAPGRAGRALREGTLRLLLTTPETAYALLERSALKTERVGHLVLAWPEQFDSDEPVTALMHDVPADAQRVLVFAAYRTAHPLLERYARRAHLAGPLVPNRAEGVEAPARPAARVATVSWSRRAGALTSLLDVLDPARLTVWCADRASAAAARAALPVADASVTITTGDAPKSDTVIAWDLPDPARTAQLASAGELVLLAPPHATAYVAQVTSRQHPLRPAGALEEVRREAGRRRQLVEGELEKGELEGDLLALAPLFERADPALVAAALYRLWRGTPGAPAPAATSAPAAEGGPARIWIGVGKKDNVAPADIVAALTRDVGMDSGKIGRIEIRELFALVEVPAGEADEIARRLSGRQIRRRTVTAKVDRGRPDSTRERSGRPEGTRDRGERPAPRRGPKPR